ncbi:nucleotidyltransferase domain-containing protein [Nitrososphaera viennensis]|uniref:Nucleotidyltransferase domain-containing protein n=1 Tax=Nitrososphaera viennensis TaxID=1034015 RepID=A0A977NKN6_9ARCH|nr:nucleotidyltransferase domain-containing protein [Nitrososphaera viennensis]UVS67848.1 nucleotidyltransferase domain-containing protein [Nitrososphaera viennensis]
MSPAELEALQKCMDRVARGRKVAAACIYGSKAAGYARQDSDIDVMVVLENYPYRVKYAYMKESGVDVSALVVDKKSLERDAKSAHMGEFVAGRLLHVYEPIANPEFFSEVERTYKRRVILEELQELVKSTSALATEISFPLEYIAFSKVRRRAAMYPNAVYSYFKTYTVSPRNLDFAMQGYRRALADIVIEDPGLLMIDGQMLRLSKERVRFARGGPALLLTKKLRHFISSYVIHSYAGRHTFHLAAKEAESKIRRHIRQPIEFPPFLACPACAYWKIPEGVLVAAAADRHKEDWLDAVAEAHGISEYSAKKRRLGNPNSRTMLYTLKHDDGKNELKIAAKELARTKSVKWAALSMWTAQVKKFKVDPMFRLGTEYRAIRYLRTLGLRTPEIEAVVLDRRILATRFMDGTSLAGIIRGALAGKEGLAIIREAGRQVAIVHAAGACFGNIKPKNVIAGDNEQQLWFTDLEQFVFEGGDPAWDLAQFVCWGLKGNTNAPAAAKVAAEFLEGYGNEKVAGRLAQSKRYIENFLPVLSPQVARAIKNVARSI